MRLTFNDRYIKGTVSFEDYGEKARMSYMAQANLPSLPIGALYTIQDKQWRVSSVMMSDYNSNVVNVYLDLV